MHTVRNPNYRIWVDAQPKSHQSKGSLDNYKQRIREAAAAVVQNPSKSNRIALEVFFESDRALRADVDNVMKPILDALIGVLYQDDRQVQTISVTAIPSAKKEAVRFEGGDPNTFMALDAGGGGRFLINVFLDAPIPLM